MASSTPTLHSPRSPSGYHRWSRCLGSIEASEGIPDTTTRWAAEGTLFHTIMARCLDSGGRHKMIPSDFLGDVRTIDGHEVECDDDMVRHLEDGIDRVNEMPGRLFVEKRVSLDRWMPGEWGTTDVGAVSRKEGLITILDWKYGSEPVEVIENEQLMIYAAGFLNWLDVNVIDYSDAIGRYDIRLIIEQPRVPGGGGTWHTTVPDILDFMKEAADKWTQSQKRGNPLTAGKKQCRWCKAQLKCQALSDFNLDIIGAKLDKLAADGIELNPPDPLTPEQRSHILLNWSMVERWHKNLSAIALDDAIKGRPVPDMKVIKGRAGKRVWKNEDEARPQLTNLLGQKAIVETLLSPTEAEKKLTKAEYAGLKGFIEQADGKPVLVHKDDKGDPITSVDEKLAALELDREED